MPFRKFKNFLLLPDDKTPGLFNWYASNSSVQHIQPKKEYFLFLKYPKADKWEFSPVFFEIEKSGTVYLETEDPVSVNPIILEFPSKENYQQSIQKILRHIHRGDIYEINFCQEFKAHSIDFNPIAAFKKLHEISEAPHSCLAKFGADYIICASPERFLKRLGKRLITQPIKGTAPRGKTKEEDILLKEKLKHSLKDQTENVMAVDVARNDLSMIATRGSVKVEELFGVYSFRQVHQMISTVSCEIEEQCSFEEIISATYPMASMTGAPKLKARQLIEKFEDFNRNFYSGSIGLLHKNGDFDLNVVIRALFYNQPSAQLSYAAGGAITVSSDPEKEWEECLLKAEAMRKIISTA